MNKQELVAEVAGNVGMSKQDVGSIIDAFTRTVSDALSLGENVMLVGFGTFDVLERKARTGRHPQTGKAIEIPDKRVPRFRPGRALKERVK